MNKFHTISDITTSRICLARGIQVRALSAGLDYSAHPPPGYIYRAVHVHNGKTVALKVQDVHHECPTNRYERAFYPLLQGGVGMPTMWEAGVQGKWDYLAIDLLGPSLDQLYRKHGKGVMDLRSVISIAIQLVCAVYVLCPPKFAEMRC